MIIRHTVTRQGRAALANRSSRLCMRALSTETTTTTTPEPPLDPSIDASAPSHAPRPKLATTLASGIQRWNKKPTKPDTAASDFLFKTRLARQTSKIGALPTRQDDIYHPAELIRNPPAPKDVTLELLLASQTHMGHHTSLWNPANSRYIHGVRGGIHIISLEQTAAHLRRAARVVEEVCRGGGLVLFVGTRKGHMEPVVKAAELSKGYSLFTKWTPGTFTNRDVLLRDGELAVLDQHDRELDGFEVHLAERSPVVPDLVVCLNPLENFVMLHECIQCNIPTIGVIDTDADPTRVTFAIPANDDSLRSISVIAGVLGRAGELGQKRRLAGAKQGIVTWENQTDVARFIDSELDRLVEEQKMAMRTMLPPKDGAKDKASLRAEEEQAMRKLMEEDGQFSEEQIAAVLRAVEREAGEMANQVANELEGEVDDAVKVELNSRIPALMRKVDEEKAHEKP